MLKALSFGMFASVFCSTFAFAAGSGAPMWDEHQKLSPLTVARLHEINLMYPNNASEANEMLQKRVFQAKPDFYRDGGIIEGWESLLYRSKKFP